MASCQRGDLCAFAHSRDEVGGHSAPSGTDAHSEVRVELLKPEEDGSCFCDSPIAKSTCFADLDQAGWLGCPPIGAAHDRVDLQGRIGMQIATIKRLNLTGSYRSAPSCGGLLHTAVQDAGALSHVR